MKEVLQLYRKRYLPNEIVLLEQDEILFLDDNLIVTKWNTLKPRHDIARGLSAYFIDKGYKVSKIYNKEDHLVYWYCDIIETVFDKSTNSYIFYDLLVDILVYEDGRVKVVDLHEIGEMLLSGVITPEIAAKSLTIANSLLTLIYNEKFIELQSVVNHFETLSIDNA